MNTLSLATRSATRSATRRTALLAAAALFIIHSPFSISRAAAQSAPGAAAPTVNSEPGTVNSGTASGGAGDEVIRLSPFVVTGNKDVGYEGLNTTSGSRIRTPLKDTPAAISVFTDEFLNDIGATTVEDIITYAANAEYEVGDSDASMNNLASRQAGNSNDAMRIRGIAATSMVDYAEFNAPIDNYNMSRLEISSGPNAILYGMGSQGGIANYTRKHADAQRNRLSIKSVFGTWTSPAITGVPYQRFTLDYNLVLKPKTFGIGLLALYQQGTSRSWQYWQGGLDRRISPLIYIKPFKNTTINLTYERGQKRDSTLIALNAGDGYTGWDAAGRPIIENYGAGQAIPGAIAQNGNNPTDTYTYMNNTTNAGQTYNLRQSYQSVGSLLGIYTGATVNNARLPENLSSIYYGVQGPAAQRMQHFEDWSATIGQSLGKFNFELSWFHSKTDNNALSVNSNDMSLYGDPNRNYSALLFNTAITNNYVPNPNTYGMYMETNWFKSTVKASNDTLRLMTNYDLNLKNWGRHRIVNLLEYANNEYRTDQKLEILADSAGVAISNVLIPSNNLNQVTRRNYVTWGDFRTYHPGDPLTPITNLNIGDRTFHSAWVQINTSANHIKRSSTSAMLLAQSYWLHDTLSTIIGARVDQVYLQRELPPIPITDPTDPRILNGTRVLNETDFTNQWYPRKTYTPFTFSTGAVYHIPWLDGRLSPFINYSTNRGLPYTDGRTVLPDGDLPPLTIGRSLDYGITIDPFANGKWSIRLTRYDTRQLNTAAILGNGLTNQSNPQVGSTNLFAIYDALHFLAPTGQHATAFLYPNGQFPAGAGLDANGNGLGPMTNAQYATTAPNAAFPNGAPPRYNAGQVDVASQGYELEITANPTKQLTFRLAASYTNRSRENTFNEIFTYFNANIPIWLKMADPNRNGGYDANGPQYNSAGVATGTPAYTVLQPTNTAGTLFTPIPLFKYIVDQLYSTNAVPGAGINTLNGTQTSVRSGLDQLLLRDGNQTGSRPYKFNATIRYAFANAPLKGLALGASTRYQSYTYSPAPNLVAYQLGPLANVPQTSNDPIPADIGINRALYNDPAYQVRNQNSVIFWDAFMTYKTKLLGGRTTMTVQLNVNNILNNYVETTGRNVPVTDLAGNTYNVPTRYYLAPPRTYRLTVGFDF